MTAADHRTLVLALGRVRTSLLAWGMATDSPTARWWYAYESAAARILGYSPRAAALEPYTNLAAALDVLLDVFEAHVAAATALSPALEHQARATAGELHELAKALVEATWQSWSAARAAARGAGAPE